MCLYSKTMEPLTAEQDITCYKVLVKNENDTYKTLYMHYVVDINKPINEYWSIGKSKLQCIGKARFVYYPVKSFCRKRFRDRVYIKWIEKY